MELWVGDIIFLSDPSVIIAGSDAFLLEVK